MGRICAVPTIFVSDIRRSIGYYRDTLGCAVDFEWGTPVFYAGVTYGDAPLHLNASEGCRERRGHSAVYLVVEEDVQTLYERIIAKGALLVGNPPRRYDYGMIDFKCADPDGNWISFAKSCE